MKKSGDLETVQPGKHSRIRRTKTSRTGTATGQGHDVLEQFQYLFFYWINWKVDYINYVQEH